MTEPPVDAPIDPEYSAFEAVLEALPDTFVLCEPTLTPAIPAGKFGLVYYIASGQPATLDRFRDLTWDLAIISPITGMRAASRELWAAVNQVLDAIEDSKTTRWSNVAIEAYNESLWCYSLQVTMYAQKTEDTPEEEE